MEITKRFVYRDYHANNHRPYRGTLHTEKDEQDGAWHFPSDVFGYDQFEDGEVVEITVQSTGERVEGRWELTSPHTYTLVK